MIQFGLQSYPAFRGVVELHEALVHNDVSAALKLSEKIVETYPSRPELWSIRATIGLLNLDLSLSESCLQRAIQLDPSNLQYYFRYAVPQMPLFEGEEQIRRERKKMIYRLNRLEKRAGKLRCPYPNPNASLSKSLSRSLSKSLSNSPSKGLSKSLSTS